MEPSHRAIASLAVTLVLAALPAAGCGPVAFRDASSLSVVGHLPPLPPPRREPLPERIQLSDKIQFATNSATILEVSNQVLDEIAHVIQKNEQIRKVRIEGHASSEGDDQHNLRLSDARAHAVRTYLVGKGIASGVLVAQGYGEGRPIASNKTPEGREANRRVEFHIVDQNLSPTQTGL